MMTKAVSAQLPEVPEDNPKRIIRFEQVRKRAMIPAYFKQRLGPQKNSSPMIILTQKEFLGILVGEDAVYPRVLDLDPEAAEEMLPMFDNRDPERKVLILAHIETSNVLDKLCQHYAKMSKTWADKEFHKLLLALAEKCQALHWEWKKSKIKYHKIVLPQELEDEAEK